MAQLKYELKEGFIEKFATLSKVPPEVFEIITWFPADNVQEIIIKVKSRIHDRIYERWSVTQVSD